MTQLRLVACERRRPMIKPLVISREVFVEEITIEVSLSDGAFVGRGEGCPALRFGETAANQLELIAAHESAILSGDRTALQSILPPGPARNAVDCAWWDLEAKRAGRRAWTLAGIETFRRIRTMRTIGLGTADEMAMEAKQFPAFHRLKLKASADDIVRRVAAVRAVQPRCEITIDANEAWTKDIYR
ncbi:MAG TPA: dipeptide epimerase, partial [Dongiaceae bacterium]|nr:dipeptide epimerase [Dongiaceae bacterium]